MQRALMLPTMAFKVPRSMQGDLMALIVQDLDNLLMDYILVNLSQVRFTH